MGEIHRHTITPQLRESHDVSNERRSEVSEVLIWIVYLPIDGGSPCFNATSQERDRNIPPPLFQGNVDASIFPTYNIQITPSSINQRRFTYGDKVIIENHDFNNISR